VAQIPASSMHVGAHPPSEFVTEEPDFADELSMMQSNVFNGEAVEGVFRGRPPGMPLLAVTNRRLMYLDGDSFEDRMALVSSPIKGVSDVAFLDGPDTELQYTTIVGMTVQRKKMFIVCNGQEEARQLHDMLIWSLIG
jgi:hypothetical protein